MNTLKIIFLLAVINVTKYIVTIKSKGALMNEREHETLKMNYYAHTSCSEKNAGKRTTAYNTILPLILHLLDSRTPST